MALSSTPLGNDFTSRSVAQTTATTDVDKDVIRTSGKWYEFFIENGNSSIVYVLVYDAKTATAAGTEPDWVFSVPANKAITVCNPTGASFSTGLSFACRNEAGGAVSSTNPSSAVKVRVVTS